MWNYLHALKWDYLNNKTRSKDKIFEEVRENIKTQYPATGVGDLDNKLDAAIRNTKAYDKALSLADEMNIFFKYYKQIKGKSVFNLFQDIGENEPGAGCWAPIGAVDLKVFWNQQGTNVLKFRNKNTEIVVDRITTYSSRQSHCKPIKIKEKGMLYSIYDYNVCLTGAGQFVKINRESVRYCMDESKNTNYVHTNTDVIGGRLHELFSDLGFTYLFFDTFQKRA